MNFEGFKSLMKEEVQKLFGEEGTILLNQVQKVNQARIGLTVRKEDSAVSPMIYLDEFFKEFQQGKEVVDIAREIIQIIKQSTLNVDSLQSHIMDYSWVKERLRVKVINNQKNEVLLKGVPHETLLDLAIVPYVALDNKGEMTSLVLDSMVAMWDINEVELLNQAKENTKRYAPFTIQKMNDFILDLILESTCQTEESDIEKELQEMIQMQFSQPNPNELFIITNDAKLNGAYAVFYEDILASLSEQLHTDGLYILPSSIHEMLVITAQEVSVAELRQMVQEVNQTTVSESDYLSDAVYYYDNTTQEIRIA